MADSFIVPAAAEDLSEFVECFKQTWPEEWAEIKALPLEVGLGRMTARFAAD